MSKVMTLNVRVTGALSDFVAENVGEYGLYENVSEYVRDLIRRDKERSDADGLAALQKELRRASATPDEDYVAVSAQDVIARGRKRWGD